MPWYLSWLLPILEKVGVKLLEQGLKALEVKFPGLTSLFQSIISWLDAQTTVGNTKAMAQLSQHVQELGIIKTPGLVREN